MPIYAVIESTLSGTVTVATTVVGIQADTWEEAVEKLRAEMPSLEIQIQTFNDKSWASYFIIGTRTEIIGRLSDEPLRIIE